MGADDPLARWRAARGGYRQVACVGDSITHGAFDESSELAEVHCWVAQLAEAAERSDGPRPGDGFRAWWRVDEWTMTGDWRPTHVHDRFDVVPFGRSPYSSGTTIDTAVWSRPDRVRVEAFDVEWYAPVAGARWQLRVDGGEWRTIDGAAGTDRTLQRLHVDERVTTTVEIRGYDGATPSRVGLAGITTYTTPAPARAGTTVHNVGRAYDLAGNLCRASAGDPLALLDRLAPTLVTAEFSNDVMMRNPPGFRGRLTTLIERVRPYADVLLMAPFEQDPAVRDTAMQARYRGVAREVAAEHGCAFVDLYEEWAADGAAGFAQATARGLMHDRLHPSQAGHDDIARRVAKALGYAGTERRPNTRRCT